MASGGAGIVAWCKRIWADHRNLVIAGIVVATALGFIIAGAISYALVLDHRVDRIAVRLHRSAPGGTTYLILGSDSRADIAADQQASVGHLPGARADLVLLLRVPDDGSTPRLLSIPRDLLVLGKDLGLHRLALTLLDGPQATIDALCQSLGVGEDHLVELDLAGFTEIVDAVGGVDVDVSAPTRDTVLNFELGAGRQHLDGPGALLYVRGRHLEQREGATWVPVPNQRAEQAQQIIRAVAHDARPSLADPLGSHRLLWSVSDALTVDSDMGLRDLWDLSSALRGIGAAQNVRLPALEDDTGPIPFALIQPGAHVALARVGAGGPACRRPALPEASS